MRWRKRTTETADPQAETLVRATCQKCGEVVFPVNRLTVHILDSGASHVAYRCPDCGVRSTQSVPLSVTTTLCRVGVSVRPLTRPAEVDEPHGGPPITEQDVTAFVEELSRPDWQAELAP